MILDCLTSNNSGKLRKGMLLHFTEKSNFFNIELKCDNNFLLHIHYINCEESEDIKSPFPILLLPLY